MKTTEYQVEYNNGLGTWRRHHGVKTRNGGLRSVRALIKSEGNYFRLVRIEIKRTVVKK